MRIAFSLLSTPQNPEPKAGKVNPMPTFPRTKAAPTRAITPIRTTQADRLERIERLTHFLDEAFQIPGTNIRVGWDTLIGLVPGLGDLATTAMSAYLIQQAREAGASKWVIARMLGNVGLDLTVGAVPLLGDAFDLFFKSNRRNARLLKRHLDRSEDAG
jgi:hypothetical protein